MAPVAGRHNFPPPEVFGASPTPRLRQPVHHKPRFDQHILYPHQQTLIRHIQSVHVGRASRGPGGPDNTVIYRELARFLL
jgi:hypothetical protein